MKLTIAHLYADEMNIYGDRGNVLTLVKRLAWRGHEAEVIKVGIGQDFDFTKADIIFAGGGQDSGQLLVGEDLVSRQANLTKALENGVVMLTVCGSYQLFGRFFETGSGQRIPGIGLFGIETYAGAERLIGNLVIDSQWGELVGFENHSGQTLLDPVLPALGKVMKGFGNDGKSGLEGAITLNAYGTYMHGPLLPKNPQFADHLLLASMQRKSDISELTPLDDELEQTAARVAKSRPQ